MTPASNKVCLLIVCSLSGLTLATLGCAGGQGPGNPFLAADRVPPPSTRVIVPGAAQPYYQGDPMPAVQGVAPLPQGGYPPTGSLTPANPAVASAPSISAEPVRDRGVVLASHNEPAIAVPADDSAARLAYNPPAPVVQSPPEPQAIASMPAPVITEPAPVIRPPVAAQATFAPASPAAQATADQAVGRDLLR